MPTYSCDICGSDTDRIFKRKVAGTVVEVCANCSDMGEALPTQRRQVRAPANPYASSRRTPSTYRSSGSASSKPRTSSGSPGGSRFGIKKTGNKFVDLHIVDNYADILQKLRAKEHMTTKEFARTLVVKDNYYHRIEKGTTMLPIDLAQKIEKLYHVKLLETVADESEEDLSNFMKKEKSAGDSMIYFRKRGEKPKYD